MEPGDPRFMDIANKEFRPVLDSWEVSAEIPTIKENSNQPSSFLAIPTEDVLLQEARGSEGTENPPEVEAQNRSEDGIPPQAQLSKSNLESLALMNTANLNGLYLPGAPATSTESINGSGRGSKTSVKRVSSNDPWAAPEQKHPSEVVVEAGATIRLSGSKSGIDGK
jgi:hypothetical protein